MNKYFLCFPDGTYKLIAASVFRTDFVTVPIFNIGDDIVYENFLYKIVNKYYSIEETAFTYALKQLSIFDKIDKK